jgi:ParB family chromosome partitioning protein
MEACHLTQEQAAEKVGRSRVAVTNMFRLLHLPKSIQEDVSRETLTMGQVKPLLLTLDKEADQLRAGQSFTLEDSGWSSRYVEKIAQLIKSGKPFQYSQKLVTSADGEAQGTGHRASLRKAPAVKRRVPDRWRRTWSAIWARG